MPIFFCLIFFTQKSYSQCIPASSDNCEDTNVLCSLDELNGVTCQTVDYSNPTACLPCKGKGVPHNSSWYAFVTDGGTVTLTITISNCINNNGLELGIVSYCDCSGEVVCFTTCTSPGTYSVTGVLAPCKIYYLWIDGCDGDICNYTINTSGGGAPKLSPISSIRRSVPDPICEGCCSDFWVDPQTGGCTPEYIWTVDGVEVFTPNERANICFPTAGTFSLCVQAVIGNPNSGSICDSKTKCTTVIVAKKKDAIAKPKFICIDDLPYKWHCELIKTSGIYRCPFLINGCCSYDSVIEITVLDPPIEGEKFFIGCPGEKYVDPITMKEYTQCENGTEVVLKNSSKPYGCDSVYFLYAIYPNFSANWKSQCINDTLIYEPRIKKTHIDCGLVVDYNVSYAWYNKLDSTKIIGKTEQLKVTESGTYCLYFTVKTTIGIISKSCTWTFCEDFDENEKLIIDVQLTGSDKAKDNEILKYTASSNQSNQILKYIWKVQGGTILTTNAQDSSEIRVLWDKLDTTNYVYVSLMTECTTSPEKCIIVIKQTETAISDINNLSPINILPNPNNGNFIISWDKNLTVNKLSIINAEGKEIYEFKISKNQTDIHIKDLKLKPGIYYARINSKDKIYTKAFVVQ